MTSTVPPSTSDVFVGRVEELGRALSARRPGFVVVTGEAGIGKTRLAEEVLAIAGGAGQRVAIGRCHDDEGAPPLWPWRQVAETLGILDDAGLSEQPDVEGDLFARFQRVSNALARVAEESPVVIVLDDVQWADRSSLRLLGFLATEMRQVPVLVVVTVRDTDVPDGSPVTEALARLARARAVHLPLTGLVPEDVARLVTATTGAEAGPEHIDQLTERTGGNPFFVTEVAQLWRGGSDRADELPVAVGDALDARIARLPHATRELLPLAATLGRSFAARVLARGLGRPLDDVVHDLTPALTARFLVHEPGGRLRFAHALVAETILARLGPLSAGLLHERAAEAIQAERDADSSIPAAELARQLDRAVAALGPTHAAAAAAAAAEAAEESSRGGAFADAAQWGETALRHARTAGADAAAQVRLLTALAVARFDSGERSGPAGSVAAQHEAIRLARTLPTGPRAAALVEAATVALRRPRTWQWRPTDDVDGEVVSALEAALAELPHRERAARVRALSALAIELLSVEGGPARGQALTAEAVELARSLDDAGMLGAALLATALTLEVPGARDRQRRVVEEVIALRSAGLPQELSAVAMLWRLGLRVALAEGRLTADPLAGELRAIVADLHDPVLALTLAWADVIEAFAECRFEDAHRLALATYHRQRGLGEFGAASLLLDHESTRRREEGTLPCEPDDILPFPFDEPDRQGLRAWAIGVGSVVRDEERCRWAVERIVPIVLPRRDQRWLIRICRLLEAAEVIRSPRARELYDALLPFAGEVPVLWPQPIHGAVDHYLGLGARSLGEHEVAADHLRAAVEIHTRIGVVPWIHRSEVELAASCLAMGEPGREELARLLARLGPRLERLGLVDLQRRVAVLSSDGGG